MSSTSQQKNWIIQANNVSRSEEQTFLSMFGTLKKDGKNVANSANLIFYSLVSISSYEQDHAEGISLRKHMTVCTFVLLSYYCLFFFSYKLNFFLI